MVAVIELNTCILGDCRESMRAIIAAGGKVQTCVTSPPYWGLRDYGHPGQLGLEPTLAKYIANMVEVFELVRELLTDDGTLWLNMGDSYTSGGRKTRNPGQTKLNRALAGDNNRAAMNRADTPKGLKPKDLIGQPWRLAFALQDAGWYLRQDIIWHKPNPMPESVRDRCTKAHEYIFLLSKSERYYFDQEAILEPASPNTHARLSQDVQNQRGSSREYAGANSERPMKAVGRGHNTRPRKAAPNGSGTKNNASFDDAMAVMPEYRNKRDVWTVPSQPYKEAHFATFPPDLIRPCILAGSRLGGVVFDPFLGSGTTAQVAQELGRHWIGCEINPEYLAMQRNRTRQHGLPLL